MTPFQPVDAIKASKEFDETLDRMFRSFEQQLRDESLVFAGIIADLKTDLNQERMRFQIARRVLALTLSGQL